VRGEGTLTRNRSCCLPRLLPTPRGLGVVGSDRVGREYDIWTIPTKGVDGAMSSAHVLDVGGRGECAAIRSPLTRNPLGRRWMVRLA
jgi:hypothetical protein